MVHTPQSARPEVSGWVGWIYFAGLMMLVLGCFNAIQGLVAIFHSGYYLVTTKRLLININYSAWGWTLLILGILVAAAGLGVMAGKLWARIVGVMAAFASAVVNIGFLAAYPVWSMIVISFDIVVIYALIVHGGEARDVE